MQQWGSNVYATSDTSGTATASPLVTLGVSTDETDDDGRRRRRRLKLVSRRRLAASDDDDDGASAPLTIVLQNLKPIDYDVGAKATYVNLSCPAGYVGLAVAVCPDTNATVKVVSREQFVRSKTVVRCKLTLQTTENGSSRLSSSPIWTASRAVVTTVTKVDAVAYREGWSLSPRPPYHSPSDAPHH